VAVKAIIGSEGLGGRFGRQGSLREPAAVDDIAWAQQHAGNSCDASDTAEPRDGCISYGRLEGSFHRNIYEHEEDQEEEESRKEHLHKYIAREVATQVHTEHENVVKFIGWYINPDDGCVHLVMEHMRHTLENQCSSLKLHPVKVILQLCKAVEYLHGRGLVHRDIKPANILLSEDLSTIKLTDFGLARQLPTANAMPSTTSSSDMAAPYSPELPSAAYSSSTFSEDLVQFLNGAASAPTVSATSVTEPNRMQTSNSLKSPPNAAPSALASLLQEARRQNRPLGLASLDEDTELLVEASPPRQPETQQALTSPHTHRLVRTMTRKAGTLATMAPEVYKGTSYSYSVDIYSIGRTITYLKKLTWRWRGIPALDEVEKMCCRDDPDERPTATMLIQYLRLALAEQSKAKHGTAYGMFENALRRCVSTSLQTMGVYLTCMGSMRPDWYITSMGIQEEHDEALYIS